MADEKFKKTSAVLPLRVESGKIFLPDNVASNILNMYPTQEGTLRAVWGPSPYVPDYDGTGLPDYSGSDGSMRGIFHGLLGEGGERDVLLVAHESTTTVGQLLVRVFEGWNRGWRNLIGPSTDSPQLRAQIFCSNRALPPTQFEMTSKGIVILPQGEGNIPYFYDGSVVQPLGYTRAPGPPIGLGPTSSAVGAENDTGFTYDAADVNPDFHQGRVGTAKSADTSAGGKLLSGDYRASVQWLNLWGDVSPLSGRSNLVHFDEEQTGNAPDVLRKFIYWTGIEPGPDGTVGRILSRTSDMVNSGTQKLFEVPPNAAFGTLAISTLSDNVTTSFPDNIPNSWILLEPIDAMLITPFRFYRVAMGVGWAANFDQAPGRIVPSFPGRWGTFDESGEIYPDPSAREITGLAPVEGGMLAFTESSTFYIEEGSEGTSFRTSPLNPGVGCVAPGSIAALPDGSVIWLGREGFYSFLKGKLGLISDQIEPDIRRINKGRAVQACAAFDPRTKEYRCWVPSMGSLSNNVCFIFDGTGWRRRDDVSADAVCVTRDHRQYMITAGNTSSETGSKVKGVWLLDHENAGFTSGPRSSTIETAWLGAVDSMRRGTPVTVFLWFRETQDSTIDIEVLRDWRPKTVETVTAKIYPPDDIPPFWDSAVLGGNDAAGDSLTWLKRRPYWTKVDIYVPGAEVFKLRIKGSKAWEFIGLSFQEVPHGDTMRIPK